MFLSGLDDIDRRLVELLIHNARMSYSDLGQAVGLSRVAVKARVRALEERGERLDIPNGILVHGGGWKKLAGEAFSSKCREGDLLLASISRSDESSKTWFPHSTMSASYSRAAEKRREYISGSM